MRSSGAPARSLAEAFKARSKASAPPDADLQYERDAIRPHRIPLFSGVGASAFGVDFSHALLRGLDVLDVWKPPLSEDRQCLYIAELCVDLNLSVNDLAAVGPPLSRWTSLVSLNLSVNQISAVAPGTLALPKLKSLNLSNNKLKHLEGLDNLPALSHLDASVNQIEDLAGISSLSSSLTSLNLAGNALETIGDGLLQLSSLQSLQLQRNRLASVPGLAACASLTSLNVSHNKLEDLRHLVSTLAPLPRLSSLTASGNPLSSLPDYRFAVLDVPPLETFDGLPVRAASRAKLAELRRQGDARASCGRPPASTPTRRAPIRFWEESASPLLRFLDGAARGGATEWADTEGQVEKLRRYLETLAEERAKRSAPAPVPEPQPPRASASPIDVPPEPSAIPVPPPPT
eukprot:tig00000282_g23842.t1